MTSLALLLFGGIACERLPLSLGHGVDGIDDVLDGDSSGFAGAGGSGVAPPSDVCHADFQWCLASGEDGDVCRDEFGRCQQAEQAPSGVAGTTGMAGFAGTGGAGGAVEPTGSAGSAGTGAGASAGTGGTGGTGGGAAGATGVGGTGDAPDPGVGGAGGAPSDLLAECAITYRLCLESGELPEVCRDVYADCTRAAGAAGASGASAGG